MKKNDDIKTGQPYNSPRLTIYGDLRQITKVSGKGGSSQDGSQNAHTKLP